MDTNEPNVTPSEEQLLESSIEEGVTSAHPINENDLSKPNTSHFDNLANQRLTQRDFLFWFAIRSSSISLFFLIAVVSIQIIMRIFVNPNIKLLDGAELEVLSVSVFGQCLGVVIIIAKSLWDENQLKQIFKQDHETKHPNGK